MAIINVRNHEVDVDMADELSGYDFGNNTRWTADKLVASSPFRTDNAPSFFVNLEGDHAGTWGDSGSLDDRYAKGNFVSLLAYLRGIGYDEACDYLIEKYGVLYEIKEGEPLRIAPPKIRDNSKRRIPLINTVTQATSPYLVTRGIGKGVQKEYEIGFNPLNTGYTSIPWHFEDGSIANVKYRSTSSKRFFYEKDAASVSGLVYGIPFVRGNSVIICEGEIDALSWAQAGYDAIALGGAHMSREQAELIKYAGITRLYLGGDNDEQGRKFNRQVAKLLRGHTEMYLINYGGDSEGVKNKDANDVLLRQGVVKLDDIIARGARVPAIKVRV